MRVGHYAWNIRPYGDGSWADDPYWGTGRAIFVEDNIFDGRSVQYQQFVAGINHINNGGRMVFRNNQIISAYIQGHSFAGRNRGTRLMEIYGNTFTYDNPPYGTANAIHLRTGTAYVWGNT